MKFELVTEDHYSNKIKRGINSQKQSNDTIKMKDDLSNYPFRVKSDLEIYTLMSALSDMVTNI